MPVLVPVIIGLELETGMLRGPVAREPGRETHELEAPPRGLLRETAHHEVGIQLLARGVERLRFGMIDDQKTGTVLSAVSASTY
jgi:hypothetical protein